MMTAFLLAAMILCTIAANLLMKLGSGDTRSSVLLGILSWRTALGLIAFGCAGLFYSNVLRVPPLNVAQSYAAAQFVAVILASAILLGESIIVMRWLGIILITAGILVVAISRDPG
jgi:multidrug transporter EmrE-like cation transporter